jgi:hypothetical protein
MAPSAKKSAKANADSSQKDLRSFFSSTQNRSAVASPPKVHATTFPEGISSLLTCTESCHTGSLKEASD